TRGTAPSLEWALCTYKEEVVPSQGLKALQSDGTLWTLVLSAANESLRLPPPPNG
ncbi:hypothetical protein P7K49_032584, partial [Saguinus oedipus]